VRRGSTAKRVNEAFEKLKSLRKRTTLGGLSWQELRDAGAPVNDLVIDSSAALSRCFEDEASPGSDALFEQVQ
jgi:hypothetical protein